MLDDLNIIAQRDPQNALDFASHEPAQLAHNFDIASSASFTQPIHNIVLTGMGGSAFPGQFIATWPQINVPFEVCRNYTLPAYVNQNTLVIASSYSGNTEETLSALAKARQKNAQIVVQAHGGKLADDAKLHKDIFIEIPECTQPRTAAFYFYRAIVEILVAAKFVQPSALQEMAELAEPLQKALAGWAKEVPTAQNQAKQLAHELAGKSVIIYAGPQMYPAAYKWKISANENAKNTAWCNTFPELSHNEFIGWTSHPIDKPFACVNLISSFEHPRVLRRFEVTEKLLSGKKPAAIEVQAKGQSVLEHLLYLILLGDFATNYLALLNGVNPTPVDLVERFKKELG